MDTQGRTLLIANPAARSGEGAKATALAARLLREALPDDRFEVARTMQPQHAVELAREATGFATVLVLGGDGIIHEAANGLMQRPASDRPTLGVIPAGSGDDYARTLGMARDPARAVAQLLQAEPRALDLGHVNGTYFTQTMSFGVDAAIGLGTMELRQRTGKSGRLLYTRSAFEQVTRHLDEFRYTARFDGQPEQGRSITFAVQVGPSYGGGFRICPDARPDDGLLDICIAHPPATIARALAIFLMAKSAPHAPFPNRAAARAASGPVLCPGTALPGGRRAPARVLIHRAGGAACPERARTSPANEGHGGKLPHSGSTLSDPDRPAANSAQEA